MGAQSVAVGPQFAVLDVETTGLSPSNCRIVSIAIVITDMYGRPTWEFSTLFNPQGPVLASEIHGITDADVAQAPLFSQYVQYLIQLLRGRVVVAHNAGFDLAFVRAEFARTDWDLPWVPSVCTLQASRVYFPHLGRWRLGDCCAACHVPFHGAHSALGDARATTGLLNLLLTTTPDRGASLRWEYEAERAARLVWPTTPTLPPIGARDGTGGDPPRQAHASAPTRYLSRPRKSIKLTWAVTYLSTVNLADALEKGAPEGSLPYLELLADAMEDGVLTIDEQAALSELATAHQLSADQVTAAHRAYLRTIATVALNDGVVTRAERAELLSVADLLDLDQSVVRDVVDQAERERNARLSQGLKSLPPDWAFGEPLHVGDKIVFTRCDADLREQLEARAEALGVRVVNSVSGRTAMLITDDTMDGTKAAEARLHHTRQVHPRDFAVMLDFLQPATSKPATPVHVHAIGTTPDASSDPFVATTSVTPAVIREWAHDNGLPVGERGRLSADLVDAFLRTAATEGSAGLTAYHSDIAATTSTQTHGGTAVSQGTGQHATGLVRGLDGDTQDAIEQPSSEPVTVDRRPTATSLDVTPASPVLPPANWYPDPHGVARLRYWDGGGWTDHTAPW